MSLQFLNRDAFVVRPRKRFCEWLQSVDDTFDSTNEASILADGGTIYLFDETGSGTKAEARVALKKHFKMIAAAEFDAWWTVEDDWAVLKTVDDFESYFEWSHVEMVCDLLKKRLERES